MSITKEQQSLLDDYNLYGYHSGGGCMHFAYDTDIDELQWLINDIDESEEPSQQYPDNKNQRCMFGLYYDYIDSKLGAKVKKELFYSSSLPNCQFYDGGFYFCDTLENGVSKMKEVTKSINNLLIEEKAS